jgi:N-acetylglucosaminyldiphosphoundecaprenol N-acetyl-beta-D-mannosaminyltransferase
MTQRYYIGNIGISQVNSDIVKEQIELCVKQNKSVYICVTNTRTVYIANHDEEYCNIQNNSFLTIPDGSPLVWIAHLKGLKNVQRVSGPLLMVDVIHLSRKNGYSHYFYGSNENVINKIGNKLKKKYPDVIIKGLVSPPFQSVEKFNIHELADELNALKPTFFWCGLGAPKQEKLIALLQPHLKSTICIGVGLAFEYYAGTVSIPPKIFKSLHLEWLYRSLQQPVKIKRFIKPFFYMIGLLLRYFIKEKLYLIANKYYR